MKQLFDTVRGIKGAALTQAEVDAINAALASGKPKALGDVAAFFAAIRPLFGGTITQAQVDGMTRVLAKMGAAGFSVAWAAYTLATDFHETGTRMQPVREGFDVSDAWRKANLRYYPWYGRGEVQTTWETNYQKMDARLGLGGTLIANPDRMLEPAISTAAMVVGMSEGLFSGHKLSDYLPADRGTLAQFTAARPIVNVHDKDALIAGYASKFQDALASGKWA